MTMYNELTLNMRGGSLRMRRERINTKAGAEEKSAVTSLASITVSALVYM